MDSDRYKKIRGLVRGINKQRRQQAKKIDILCNDMVGAHKEFLEQLGTLSAGFGFYESLLGHTDLGKILAMTFNYVYQHVNCCDAAVILTDGHNFQVHQANTHFAASRQLEKLCSSLSNEIVHELSRANGISSLGDMFELGLTGNLGVLNEISAAAVPIGRVSGPVGFILICRDIEHPLTRMELEKINAINPGLCSSLRSSTHMAGWSSSEE